MTTYPMLEIDLQLLRGNFDSVLSLCDNHGIKVSGVIKGFNGLKKIVEELDSSQCTWIASSRIDQLIEANKLELTKPLMLIRMPMKCEIPQVIENCEVSLNSDKDTILLLDKEARNRSKIHGVIVMYDLGDLREGIFDRKEMIDLCTFIEYKLENIKLLGIGTNLSCYGSVVPTTENLDQLVSIAEEIEELIDRKLEIISGGATTSLPLVLKDLIPKRINHLRIGEAMTCAQDLIEYMNTDIPGLSQNAFVVKAQIIEVNLKPTHPIGKLGINAFGDTPVYIDRGIRKRAILAIGNQDLGNVKKLIPKDENIEVIGGSSDHTIVDINDSDMQYDVGDIIEFNLYYQAMLFASESPYVNKVFKG